MHLEADTCHRALRARDVRFDGLFFVGVTTTGIYCRPICPARTPRRDRCAFFASSAQAERAGFRACLRCRPELAPGAHTSVDAPSQLVRAAVAQIDAGFLDEGSLDALAAGLGVTARHVRRVMEEELGVSPIELAQTRRLGLAKQLLQDTELSLAEIAFASGFASVRRFNASFRARFGAAPSVLRRAKPERGVAASAGVTLRLDYRPPLDWAALLAFLRGRAIAGVESIDDDTYRRTVAIDDAVGWVSVTHGPSARAALSAFVSSSLVPKLLPLVAALRRLFDLDAAPSTIADQLGADPVLTRSVARRPGLRVPGAFDPFELAIRAILGQQVTVRAATTICGRLVERFGVKVDGGLDPSSRRFPRAEELATKSIDELASIGLPGARAATIAALSRAIAERTIALSPGVDPEDTITRLVELPGIGPWTAHYIAMRALAWPNAFPAGDLAVKKALGLTKTKMIEARARAWEPWRAYAVMHLWAGE